MLQNLLFFLFSLLLVSCGSDTKSGGESPVTGPFLLTEKWNIVSKQCEKTNLPLFTGESYQVDADHFIRTVQNSENATELCKTAFIFDRTISKHAPKDLGYLESGVIKSSKAKTTCWKKENGTAVNPPTSENIYDFGPETYSFEVLRSGKLAAFTFKNSPECPNGMAALILQNP